MLSWSPVTRCLSRANRVDPAMSVTCPLYPQLLSNWCGAAKRRDVPEADLACWITYAMASWRQRVEQCLGLLQKGRIEALGEPAVDRAEKIAGRIALAPLTPEAGKTGRSP